MGLDPRIAPTGWWNEQILFTQGRTKRRKRTEARDVLVKLLEQLVPENSSIADLGAGPGWLVMMLNERGYQSFGIEGCPKAEELTDGMVLSQDLTGNCSEFFQSVDWAICYEVGEHVPKEYERQFIDNISWIPRNGLIVSWATHPGSRMSSEGHVNCRTMPWVASQFGKRGWIVDEERMKLVQASEIRKSLKRRLLVFERWLR